MAMVRFVDETTAGARSVSWALEIFEERLALRELIRRRIYQEVAEHNAAEAMLNGYRMRQVRRVDPQRQFDLAVSAFSRNGFVVLVDDRQVEELDDVVELRRDTEVTFLKLVPLVGG
jgi:hypothetical protein